jgi:hypothetical protein
MHSLIPSLVYDAWSGDFKNFFKIIFGWLGGLLFEQKNKHLEIEILGSYFKTN